MKTTRKIFLLVLVAILSGCAARDQIIKGYSNSQKPDFNSYSDLLLEPVDTVGIMETPALRDGKMGFYEVVFPEILFLGEIFPGRIKWYGWVADDNGNEYLAQLLWVYRVKVPSGKLVGVLAVEGGEKEMVNPKAIGLSTRFKFAYGLDEKETETAINQKEFVSNPAYRKKIVREQGIPLEGLKKADYMYPLVNTWDRVKGPRGFILTPLKEKQFLQVAEINPAYTYSQKLVEYSTGTIVLLDPIATGVSAFFDLTRSLNAPSKGWGFDSKVDRRTCAIVAKHLIDVKQAAIDARLRKIEKANPGGLR